MWTRTILRAGRGLFGSHARATSRLPASPRVTPSMRTMSSQEPESLKEAAASSAQSAMKAFGVVMATTVVAGVGIYTYQISQEKGINIEELNRRVDTKGKRGGDSNVDPLRALIAKNQELKPVNFQGVIELQTAWLNANDPMEDRHSAHSLGAHGVLVGMFDGHSGFAASDAASTFLSSYINKSLTNVPPNADELTICEALEQAFLDFDRDFTETVPNMALKTGSSDVIEAFVNPALAGAVSVNALIHPTGIFVANTGDCRCVMGVRRGVGHRPVIMSIDQTGDTPSEILRLQQEHPGEEESVVRRGRVLGNLQPARAFGDSRYKWSRDLMQQLGVRVPNGYLTPPYVTARPEVLFYPHAPANAFLIMATDGLWDVVDPEAAVQTVSQALANGADALSAAGKLVHHALENYAREAQLPLDSLMEIPAGQARNFRDDITVTVVMLDSVEKPPVIEETAPGVPSVIDAAQILSQLSSPPDVLLPQVFENAVGNQQGSNQPANQASAEASSASAEQAQPTTEPSSGA